jgi:hypothetical protein
MTRRGRERRNKETLWCGEVRREERRGVGRDSDV